jgi:hypothetical protein
VALFAAPAPADAEAARWPLASIRLAELLDKGRIVVRRQESREHLRRTLPSPTAFHGPSGPVTVWAIAVPGER